MVTTQTPTPWLKGNKTGGPSFSKKTWADSSQGGRKDRNRKPDCILGFELWACAFFTALCVYYLLLQVKKYYYSMEGTDYLIHLSTDPSHPIYLGTYLLRLSIQCTACLFCLSLFLVFHPSVLDRHQPTNRRCCILADRCKVLFQSLSFSQAQMSSQRRISQVPTHGVFRVVQGGAGKDRGHGSGR